ncbi:UDP-N-acetylmuramoyl-L-alanine--D-glutamate ligase [Acidipila sp. EB88]|uniref:UDP-N-acetylmuramoyl-L-alanine--D-glutamate ligase n=1 Tax=Acidipila sp. EB88 TaxID=2305226 RepID=UPI000F5F5E0E|nr:UDP-N-acetylmuramoyl-L-alanine--D-glutamate ligase [Acidipila sp. EB88]RRA48875.1 UDP-N-acetylmuramoyl-L-alanine--D-glutamate ligase [Acidipila sp. EB88]
MELKGKRVLVVGLGRSGLAAALFLRRQGAQVTVSDMRSAKALELEIPMLLEEGIAVEAGGHGLLTFRRQDLLVLSPGVPLDTPEIRQVRAFGQQIVGEVELASRFLKGRTLAITGSNGKTTTTTLCGAILAASGVPTVVGGNIGVPVVALTDASRDEGWNVLEISSFQLETIDTFRPEIAVLLNITPDHLDRHGSFEKYREAKERIFANQTAADFLVLNADDDVTHRAAARAQSQVFWFSRKRVVRQGAFVHEGVVMFRATESGPAEPVLPVAAIPLKGVHNLENVLAAVVATRLAGVPAEVIHATVSSFQAVEHRLEFVADVRGVAYYNDSKATNVDAAAKAVSSFPAGVHLILGGKDKDSDYRALLPLIRERVRAVYTIGAAAAKIESHLDVLREQAGAIPVVRADTLERAVALASESATPGETVLLAPACSSFDQFRDYEQRGERFKDLVRALPLATAQAPVETSDLEATRQGS